MIWDEVVDSLDGAVRNGCPVRETILGLTFDVPARQGYPLHVGASRMGDLDTVRSMLVEILHDLAEAHPFAFENVPVEYDGLSAVYPKADPDEVAFCNEGLVPTPFPLAWFEHTDPYGHRGWLARENGSLIEVVEFARQVINGRVRIDVHLYHQELDRPGYVPQPVGAGGGAGPPAVPRHERDTNIHRRVRDPLGLHYEFTGEDAKYEGEGFLVYLLVMLGSRSTETETLAPGKFANRRRKEKGRRPLPAMTVVRIVPRRVADRMRAEGEEVHASPRMHWRRSHARTLADGRRVLVSRCLVGFKALDGAELMQGVLEHRYKVA